MAALRSYRGWLRPMRSSAACASGATLASPEYGTMPPLAASAASARAMAYWRLTSDVGCDAPAA